jgi:hypothetical protein
MNLFTSIRPPASADELAYLRDCLNSWRGAGFAPIAVNGPNEIERLRELDLPVEFAPLPTDGKPRIGAILSAIRETGAPFCGIINSDCKIIGYPDLAANLAAGLKGRVAAAWRLDIDGPRVESAAQKYGFDAFFFDTAAMPDDDCGFSIGEAFWDTWFPLACEAAGARVEAIEVPLLTHRIHPTNWSDGDWLRGARRFWPAFQGWHARGLIAKELLARLPTAWLPKPTLSFVQFRCVGAAISTWLHEDRLQTVALLPPEMSEVEAMLRLGSRALFDAAEFRIVKYVLRRMIKPLRIAISVFREIRAAAVELGDASRRRFRAGLKLRGCVRIGTAASALRRTARRTDPHPPA